MTGRSRKVEKLLHKEADNALPTRNMGSPLLCVLKGRTATGRAISMGSENYSHFFLQFTFVTLLAHFVPSE
eukprot:scaffold2836_cov99-Cylindrotheca_fusiformis.AAC.9